MKINFAGYYLGSLGKNSASVHIKAWDYLLIVAACFAPMTGWRLGHIGPGEAVCLLWCIGSMRNFKIKVSDTLIFFVGFICALLLGSAIGVFVAKNELLFNQMLTWLYLAFISVMIYQGLSDNSREYNEKLLIAMAFCTVLWQLFLYEYSFNVDREFFGAPLWYGGWRRYAGGATNPHQVALLFCGMLFVLVRGAFLKRNIVISLAVAYASYFLMIKTESATGKMSIILAALFLLYMFVVRSGKNRIVIAALLTIAIIAIIIIMRNKIYNFIMDWIREDKNGEDRLELFSMIGAAFKKSPFFGLGPGVHSRAGRLEFHNTYLEVLAATGILGTALFASYTKKVFMKLYIADWRLIPIAISLYAYGFAGFALRRLIYWIILAAILALAESIIRERMQSGSGYLIE